ncbi:MAG: histidine kinase dimerization/phospho-acceptor domain-containing protein [Candidatus Rokuibacteriota bacterium]
MEARPKIVAGSAEVGGRRNPTSVEDRRDHPGYRWHARNRSAPRHTPVPKPTCPPSTSAFSGNALAAHRQRPLRELPQSKRRQPGDQEAEIGNHLGPPGPFRGGKKGLVALLFIAIGGVSLQTMARMWRQGQSLDQAHERVRWSQQIDHALALQMHFTAMALLLNDETTVEKILRENNRFNDTLARIEEAAPPDERALIAQIRAAQEDAMIVVADIANLIRDGKRNQAMEALLTREEPVYRKIGALVGQVVASEEARMASLRANVDAANRQSLRLAGAFAALSILLALVLGFVISWSFILPVQEAKEFLGRVATGDFGTTVSIPNRDEFGALAAHMNHMSRELQRLDQKQRDSAEELRRLNDRLAQASRAKSEFLASMSHELRTPMNAILGFTEMMLDGLYGEIPAKLKEPLTDVRTNGTHLLRLINDVLDLSKIEAGRMELAPAEYAVQDVLNTVRISLRSLASEKGLEFITATAAELPLAYGDSKRIIQCLMNLAGNALKFTKEGQVEISVALEVGGKIVAWEHTIVGAWHGAGFVDDKGRTVSAFIGSNHAYGIPNQVVRPIRGEHGIPGGAYRSVGPGYTNFAVETFLDELAHLAKVDPLRMRLAMLGGQPRLTNVMRLAAARSGWGTPLPPNVGRGLAGVRFALLKVPPTWLSAVVQARVDRPTGEVAVEKITCAVDCGIVVNPDGVRAQIEGGLLFGLSTALKESGTVTNGALDQRNFEDYQLLRMDEVPEIEIHIVDSTEPPSGIGEPPVTVVAPALSNAIFAATGVRVRNLPFLPERVLQALREKS